MKRYTAYNALYKNGKRITQPYVAGYGKTYSSAKRNVSAYNRYWNKLQKGKNRTYAKTVYIKSPKRR